LTDNLYRWVIVIALVVIALAQVSQTLNAYNSLEQLEDIARLLAP